jgi:NifU-like protein
MSLNKLVQPFPWSRYSKKLIAKIERPRCAGFFTKEQSEERGMRLAIGTEGTVEEGNQVTFYWLVDLDDGIIVDSRFQVYGQSALIGAAEVTCELLIGKNYDQGRRIGAELIDKQVRDRPDEPSFPKETSPHLNLILGAIDQAGEQCLDIPLSLSYTHVPAPREMGDTTVESYPNWELLTHQQKLGVIEQVVARDVRPYIELDAGGIIIKDLLNDKEVIIAYQGSCTSCFSATGTTLSYIQQVLRTKLHASLLVIPDLSNFQT